MNSARNFETGEIVLAQDVFDGKHSRYENYVDEEEDFRVVYVKAAKNNGRPYFKLYLSREDYNKLSEEQKTKYDILCEQRHFQESAWHRGWEKLFKDFSEIEKTIKNPKTNKRKRADAFCKEKNLCIEFQHSFINHDFEERNSFYSELGMKTIWLYDLTSLSVKAIEDGYYSMLENNAKGFFRVAENPINLKNNFVFIQAKDKMIYLIDKLERKNIDNDLKSTVRYFKPREILTVEEFIERIKKDSFVQKNEANKNDLYTIYELWDPRYYQMIVENSENNDLILIHKDNRLTGKMQMNYNSPNCILYKYVILENNKYRFTNDTYYNLNSYKANQKKWQLVWGFK